METKNYRGNFVIILLCDIHDTMKLFAFLLWVMWMVECSTVSASKPTLWLCILGHKTAEKHRCLAIRICLSLGPLKLWTQTVVEGVGMT